MNYPSRTALVTSLGLAQMGEFSFFLAGVGKTIGLIPEEIFQVFIASSILTILATPFLIRVAPGLAAKSDKLIGPKPRPKQEREKGESMIFGDISSREVLKAAGIKKTRMVLFVISDPRAIKAGIKAAREMNREVYIIVRARLVSEIEHKG